MQNDSWRHKVTSLFLALALVSSRGWALSSDKPGVVVLASVVAPESIMEVVTPESRTRVVSPRDRRDFDVARVCRFSPARTGATTTRIVVATDDPSLDSDADSVARIAFRCWEQSSLALGFEVPATIDQRRIVIFLSKDGQPGGEEMTSSAVPTASGYPMAAVFINQVGTLTDKVERMREVAHECGHVLFPAIGGFSSPESWSNGEMAERVIPAMLLRAMDAGGLTDDDVGGVPASDMRQYVERRYDTAVDELARSGPSRDLERGRDSRSFAYTVNMLCFAHAILPAAGFRRAVALGRGGDASDLARGLEEAVAEGPASGLDLPARFVGRTVWLPRRLQSGRGLRVVAHRDTWTKVQINSARVAWASKES